MAAVEDPAKILRLLVGGVDDTRDVLHDYVALLAPLLDGEVLNVDVASALGGAGGVDHVDGGLVVFVEDRRASRRESEFAKHGAEVLGDFGSIDGGDEFGFGGAGSNSGLDLGLVGNGGAG
jgi:hypothetical protein